MKRFVAVIAIVFFIIISNIRLFGLVEHDAASHLFNLKGYEIMTVDDDLESSSRLVPQGSILGHNDTDTVTFIHTVRVGNHDLDPLVTVNLHTNEGIKTDTFGLINHTTTLIETNDDIQIYQTILTLNRPSTDEERALFRSVQSFNISFSLKS